MADRRANLGELLDRVADLLVEDLPIGDDDDRIENRSLVLGQADELVGQPGDGIGLTASRRVLDEIPFAYPVQAGIGMTLTNLCVMEVR